MDAVGADQDVGIIDYRFSRPAVAKCSSDPTGILLERDQPQSTAVVLISDALARGVQQQKL